LTDVHPYFKAEVELVTQVVFENVANHGCMEVIPILIQMLQCTVETINGFAAEF
jgi:hypothetical protein